MKILYDFTFFYPLFMAFVWMSGALIFFSFRKDKKRKELSKDAPLVSILVPCHNEEGCIRETVEFLMKQNYPNFEVVAVDDGSTDNTVRILKVLQLNNKRLRVVRLMRNRGKGAALTLGALAANGEYLVCIDADALLAADAVEKFIWHFQNGPRVGAVTGNPRIRNRTSILGKIQVGEFSSLVNMIKQTQRIIGKVYSISGVVCAFRKRALLSVGFWSDNMVTEDVDISWKLQLNFWDIRYEPGALCWILMPETIRGLFRQRLRWAQGGNEVLMKYFRKVVNWKQRRIWPVYIEAFAGVLWSYAFMFTLAVWILHFFVDLPSPFIVQRVFPPQWTGTVLASICLVQFGVGFALDSRYEKNLYRLFFWLIWYPAAYWLINAVCSVTGLPKAVLKRKSEPALWKSPDRGI
jgi:poly-beta-1,6-N-acetyl-D-glucosamine synthase